MKNVFYFVLTVCTVMFLAFSTIWFADHISRCAGYKQMYVWVGWAGGQYDAGYDLDVATKLANGRPIETKDVCIGNI